MARSAFGDPAAKVDGEAERHLGDGLGEGGAGRQHMDATLEAGLVVDVLEEIRLDVDDRAEFRRPIEPRLRHVRLADQEGHLGQIGFERFVRHPPAAVVHDEVAGFAANGATDRRRRSR